MTDSPTPMPPPTTKKQRLTEDIQTAIAAFSQVPTAADRRAARAAKEGDDGPPPRGRVVAAAPSDPALKGGRHVRGPNGTMVWVRG